MGKQNKCLEKIRAVIYNVNEARLTKVEGFNKIEKIMDIHNKLGVKKDGYKRY